MANLQAWECTLCERDGSDAGSIPFETGADGMSVAYAVLEDHSNTSPDCEGGVHTIRVHQPLMDPQRDSDD